MFPLVLPPPPHLRQCIDLAVVAGWLLLDTWWFVLFLSLENYVATFFNNYLLKRDYFRGGGGDFANMLARPFTILLIYLHKVMWVLFSRRGFFREKVNIAKNAKITPTRKFPRLQYYKEHCLPSHRLAKARSTPLKRCYKIWRFLNTWWDCRFIKKQCSPYTWLILKRHFIYRRYKCTCMLRQYSTALTRGLFLYSKRI